MEVQELNNLRAKRDKFQGQLDGFKLELFSLEASIMVYRKRQLIDSIDLTDEISKAQLDCNELKANIEALESVILDIVQDCDPVEYAKAVLKKVWPEYKAHTKNNPFGQLPISNTAQTLIANLEQAFITDAKYKNLELEASLADVCAKIQPINAEITELQNRLNALKNSSLMPLVQEKGRLENNIGYNNDLIKDTILRNSTLLNPFLNSL